MSSQFASRASFMQLLVLFSLLLSVYANSLLGVVAFPGRGGSLQFNTLFIDTTRNHAEDLGPVMISLSNERSLVASFDYGVRGYKIMSPMNLFSRDGVSHKMYDFNCAGSPPEQVDPDYQIQIQGGGYFYGLSYGPPYGEGAVTGLQEDQFDAHYPSKFDIVSVSGFDGSKKIHGSFTVNNSQALPSQFTYVNDPISRVAVWANQNGVLSSFDFYRKVYRQRIGVLMDQTQTGGTTFCEYNWISKRIACVHYICFMNGTTSASLFDLSDYTLGSVKITRKQLKFPLNSRCPSDVAIHQISESIAFASVGGTDINLALFDKNSGEFEMKNIPLPLSLRNKGSTSYTGLKFV